MKNIRAVMFDFDGTITEKGEDYPTSEMSGALIDLAQTMPIAFCTGRQLESFIENGLDKILFGASPSQVNKFMQNLYLIVENGAFGYNFNTEKNDFENFYAGYWPEDIIARDNFMEDLDKKVKKYGEVLFNSHKVTVVARPHEHGITNVEQVYSVSKKLFNIMDDFLSSSIGEYCDHLHLGNSGLGVLTGPADYDKDRGIMEFGKKLMAERGFDLSSKYDEILVVGDNPQRGGNDYSFLSGKFGLPFSVGEEICNANPVFDRNDSRLFHSKGTLHLIKQLL